MEHAFLRQGGEATSNGAQLGVREPLTAERVAKNAVFLVLGVLGALAACAVIIVVSFFAMSDPLDARRAAGSARTLTDAERRAEVTRIARSELAAALSAADDNLALRINRAYEAARRGNFLFVTYGTTASGAPTSVSRIDGVSPTVQIRAEVRDGRPTFADALAGRAVLLVDMWRTSIELSMEANSIDMNQPPLGTCIAIRALVHSLGERRDAPNAGQLCWQLDSRVDAPRWVYVPPPT
jgi:hypothetical protein